MLQILEEERVVIMYQANAYISEDVNMVRFSQGK
jgi:hypothetical protein